MTLAILVAVALCAEPSDAPLRVSPGMQEVLKVPGLTRAAVADPTVADVTAPGGDELLVLGHKPGRTTLTLWMKGKKPVTRMVIVDDGRFAELSQMVKEKVDPTLKAEVFGDKLVIDGTLDSVDDYQRLKTLVGDQPNVKLLVTLSPRALPALANAINAEFRRQGLVNATAKALGGKLVLEGSVSDEKERAKAQLIAEGYYAQFGK